MNARYDKKKNTLYFEWDSVSALMASAGKWDNQELLAKSPSLKSNVEEHATCFRLGSRWNDQHTLAMVEKELLAPTPKMADVIDAGEALFTSDDFAARAPRRRVCRRLEDGDEIDIDRWLDREPDMWEEMRRTPAVRAGVRIGVNCATSAKYGPDAFKWRTSTVLAILRICEEMRIPCEVVGYEVASNAFRINGKIKSEGTRKTSFLIKKPEQLLDMDMLGYVLGSQAFLRCAVFGAEIVETCLFDGAKGKQFTPGFGLGYPDEVKDVEPNEFILDRGCLDVGRARMEVERFKDWLKNFRRKANINLDGLDT